MEFVGENWSFHFDVHRSCDDGEDGEDMDSISFSLFNNRSTLISESDFEIFIINFNDEIIEDAETRGNVYLDRLKSPDEENLEDISYRVVINVFPEIKDE